MNIKIKRLRILFLVIVFFNYLNCDVTLKSIDSFLDSADKAPLVFDFKSNLISASHSDDALILCVDFPKVKKVEDKRDFSYWCSSSSCGEICFYNTLKNLKKRISLGGQKSIYALGINRLVNYMAFGYSQKLKDELVDYVVVSGLLEFIRNDTSSFKLFKGHKDLIKCVSWSPIYPFLLASGSLDGTVKIWDTLLEECAIKSLQFDTSINKTIPVFCLDWANSYECKYEENTNEIFFKLAAGFSNGSIKIWDLKISSNLNQTIEVIKETILKSNDGYVASLNWSKDDKFIVAGYQNGSIRIWDLEAKYRKCIYNTKGHSWGVSQVKFYKDSLHFISTGLDGVIKFWDVKNRKNEELYNLRFDNGFPVQIYCLDLYPSDLFLIAGLKGDVLTLDISHLLRDYSFEIDKDSEDLSETDIESGASESECSTDQEMSEEEDDDENRDEKTFNKHKI